MSLTKLQRLGLTGIAAVLAALPLAAQGPELAMLGTLTPGNWELRSRSGDGSRTICLRTGRELVQLQHRQGGCTSYVVQDDPTQVVVQYTCRGDGYGRTTIRREASNLVQVSSQGSQAGAPFSISGEARRVGPC